MDDPAPPLLPAEPGAPLAALDDTLSRIDGWGPLAWKEITGVWRGRGAGLVLEPLESAGEDAPDWSLLAYAEGCVLPPLPAAREDLPALDRALADWALRRCAREVLGRDGVNARTLAPGAAIRASNAALVVRSPGRPATLGLRLQFRPPAAGMTCDALRLRRFLRRVLAAVRATATGPRPGLAAHCRAVLVQTRLRAALPAHGLVAFLGDGALLARDADDRPLHGCRPLRAPRGLACTIDLGALGRFRGLGIRTGVTACCGAPYHGKSTLLRVLAAGREDHPPGDGREHVVCDPHALAVQAEDGRRIKDQDLRAFFSYLPGASPARFATAQASGATSMAATLLQAAAAGVRTLLIDEDAAAGNFLRLDADMRRLLGARAGAARTLVEVLPALTAAGLSTVLVAGSSAAALAAADRVLLLDRFRVRDATRRARQLLRLPRPRPAPPLAIPPRRLDDHPDCLFGPRHFLLVEVDEPERPQLAGAPLDLRRCGWPLDAPLVRGALAAAAWCCRLADGRPTTMDALADRYAAFITARGARGLDPFDTQLLVVPPWPLVALVLERLPRPHLR